MHARIGNDAEHSGFARHLVYAHLHAGVDRANQHVNFVALNQFVGILHTFGRFRLIVNFEIFNVPATEFVAFFFQCHAKSVVTRQAKLRKRAGVRQHQPDTHFGVLGPGGKHQSSRSCAQKSCGLCQYLSTRSHGVLQKMPLKRIMVMNAV
jgi:hypothetical protein